MEDKAQLTVSIDSLCDRLQITIPAGAVDNDSHSHREKQGTDLAEHVKQAVADCLMHELQSLVQKIQNPNCASVQSPHQCTPETTVNLKSMIGTIDIRFE